LPIGLADERAEPVRVAIVGTGNIARNHAKSLAAAGAAIAPAGGPPAATLVAAADVNEARLTDFCEEHAVGAAYHDLDDLLRKERPDLVHVCTPPGLHHPQALACLRAGSSALVEKPPAISLREFDEIAAAEGDPGTGPAFATVFQHRFGSGQLRLKALASRGELGRPLLAICNTTWFRDQAYFDVPWRGRWDTEGGGPTMGHGIHQMDMLLDVLGDWTEVSAVARTQGRRVQTEDVSLANVTFASGAVASVVNSVLSPREETYLRYDFERATVEVTHLYGYTDKDWRVTPVQEHEQDVLTAWESPGDQTPGDQTPGDQTVGDQTPGDRTPGGSPGPAVGRSGHVGQFIQVLTALRTGRRPPVAPAESRRTMALIAAIYASAFTKRPVTPDDLAPGTPFYDRMNGGISRW
jgi:predicted dehydrogenase